MMSAMKIPDDEEQKNIIDKLANFVARNGPKFEQLTKSKQKDNPKFAFLFGGEFHAYYCWKVGLESAQCEAQKKLTQQEKESGDSQPPSLTNQPSTLQPNQPAAFDVEDFREVLQKLILACTKDNIQNGKNWIVSNAKTDEEFKGCARFLLRRMLEEVLPFQQKLHIIYLANDLLHHGRKKSVPQLHQCLQHYILPIVALVHNGESEDNQQKLAKVIKIWENQKLFDAEVLSRLSDCSALYDSQLEVLELERNEMSMGKKEEKEVERREQSHLPPPGFQPFSEPPLGFPPPGQFPPFLPQQYSQWQPPANSQQQDPFHFYSNNYTRPPAHLPPRFPPPPGDGAGFDGQPRFQQFDMPQFPGPEIQTFDYSHQRMPAPSPQAVTFDYEHGRAQHPPEQDDVHDPTIPMAPYHDLPAGLMVPLIKLWDCDYKPIDPKDLRLPIPQPPSERLLAAIEAFYSPPSHDRPRDSQGWEKNGLFEFYKAKLKYIKDKERNLAVINRTPSPLPSRSPTPESVKSSHLVKERKKSESPARERSVSRERKRSVSPYHTSHRSNRSRSRSRSPRRFFDGSKSQSYSESPKRSPVRRSPTPPEGFMGFNPLPVDSRLDGSNVGHQMLTKMGWSGQGLGKKESGIIDPIKGGEVRDRQDKFKGIGVNMNDPYENFRKNKSYSYSRPRERPSTTK